MNNAQKAIETAIAELAAMKHEFRTVRQINALEQYSTGKSYAESAGVAAAICSRMVSALIASAAGEAGHTISDVDLRVLCQPDDFVADTIAEIIATAEDNISEAREDA